jgi:antagonist of KipI
MSVSIVRAGFFTTVQDLGRPGSREHGVSSGGALDLHALRIANLLVGNDASAAGLETTMGRVRVRFNDQRTIAWCGGAVQVAVAGAAIPAGRAAVVEPGEELSLVAPERAARAWLAISGGIDVPVVLGSRSTDLRARFGGFEGRPLRDDDVLPVGDWRGSREGGQSRIADWGAAEGWAQTGTPRPFLRIVRGAHWEHFPRTAHEALVREQFTVAAEADRMGARLKGPELARCDDEELISEAVAPGTIQVPPNGQPILLLGDCQTIGGYPKLAHVITVDLPIAAQLRPGDTVLFSEVSLDDARALLRERERDVNWFRAGVALRMR